MSDDLPAATRARLKLGAMLGAWLCRAGLHDMRLVATLGLTIGPPTLNRCRRCQHEELDYWD